MIIIKSLYHIGAYKHYRNALAIAHIYFMFVPVTSLKLIE